MMRIGEAVTALGLSADTLRYYEKIKLMPKVQRNGALLQQQGSFSATIYQAGAKNGL